MKGKLSFSASDVRFSAGFGGWNARDVEGGQAWLLLVLGGPEPRDGPAGHRDHQGHEDRTLRQNTEGQSAS